jgi:hypothetical protein
VADKQITVAVPEERVPEFYLWFSSFLVSEAGASPRRGGPGRRSRGLHHHRDAQPWSAADADQAAWLYARLAPPARSLFDLLAASPGSRLGGNELAARLAVDKGAHGIAGILAWPGRYSRRLGRVMPIATEGREDGGTDYYMEPDVAALFTAAPAPPAVTID